MANTLEIIEQMSYLIFFRRLEITDSDNERKAKVDPKKKKHPGCGFGHNN